MIFFFGEGRLGNQLFQYIFIKSVEKKEQMIFSYNFEEIMELFGSIPNVINIQNSYLRLFARKIAIPILECLAKAKIISSYKIDSYIENGHLVPDTTFSQRKGLLPITYFYPCYAQSEKFFNLVVIENLTINKTHIKKAEGFLKALPENHNNVFVHVRRGDYIHFSVFDKKGVTLPLSYYKGRIKWFEENIKNPFYIFLTDDREFVENCFESVHNKVISKNSMFVDFAIITLCQYGIMSNSSFSWWGARMMESRKKVFAPKYWLGWKSGVEYHKGIAPSFAEMVEIGK